MPYANANSEMLTYEKDTSGLIKAATIPNGTPVTTASMFAPGALVTSLEDSKIYRNSGTTAVPVWDSISAITSDEIDTGLIRVLQVSLTAAQINGMAAAPVEIIPAVAGKAIILDDVVLDLTGTATQFANGGVVNLQYKNTATGAGTTLHADIAASVVTGATARVLTKRIAKDLSAIATADITGVGVFISNKTAAFDTGTGTAVVTVRYHLV